MFIAGLLQDRHSHLKEIRIGIRIRFEFSSCLAQKKFGVLLVGEAVGGNVVGAHRDGFLQGLLPLLNCLTREAKYEIYIDIHASCLTQNMKRLLGLCCIMFPSEDFEQRIVPGLTTETDSIHSEFA